ncbi:MAG: hypothetical protein CSA11_11220 [Chloroflexi bacterium]|nr:MAG: hypothetical protein CSA11_11220 [Chloroflexota bacterium]
MANHNKRAGSQQSKQINRNKTKPPQENIKSSVEHQGMSIEFSALISQNTDGTFAEGFSTHLGDSRFFSSQRQQIAAEISKFGGNPFLQRVVSGLNRENKDFNQRPTSEPQQTQGTFLSSNPSLISRNNGDDEQPHVTFEPFGDLTTYNQLVAVIRFFIEQVRSDLQDVPEGEAIRTRATEWIAGSRGWISFWQQSGDSQISEFMANQARLHFEEMVAIREAIVNIQQRNVQREMERVAARARAGSREVAILSPHLNDCLRAAFRANDTNAISNISSTISSALDIGLGLQSLARESAESLASIKGISLPPVGRYVIALERLNRGLALCNLAFTLTQREATTPLEEGVRQISNAASTFSSLATLAGLPAHMGLYANLYLIPMTMAIMAGISQLARLLQQENDTWVGIFGEPLYYDVEPGNNPQHMWRFMVSLMQANSSAGVPPITDDIGSYLLAHRSALEAGSGEEVPTSGWWFWRSLQSSRAREWLFNNRSRVWGMFYGSRAVPD